MKKLILSFLLMLCMCFPAQASNVIINGQYVINEEVINEVPPINKISQALDES